MTVPGKAVIVAGERRNSEMDSGELNQKTAHFVVASHRNRKTPCDWSRICPIRPFQKHDVSTGSRPACLRTLKDSQGSRFTKVCVPNPAIRTCWQWRCLHLPPLSFSLPILFFPPSHHTQYYGYVFAFQVTPTASSSNVSSRYHHSSPARRSSGSCRRSIYVSIQGSPILRRNSHAGCMCGCVRWGQYRFYLLLCYE